MRLKEKKLVISAGSGIAVTKAEQYRASARKGRHTEQARCWITIYLYHFLSFRVSLKNKHPLRISSENDCGTQLITCYVSVLSPCYNTSCLFFCFLLLLTLQSGLNFVVTSSLLNILLLQLPIIM